MRAAAVDALVAIAEARSRPRRSVAGARTPVGPRRGEPGGPLAADRPDVAVRHRAIAAAAALEDREAIPALLAAAESPDSRFEAGDGPRRAARSPRLAGLPPRPGRQEHRPAPGLGHRDRQHPRPGRPGARPAREPQRAVARAPARAAHDLRRPGSRSPPGGSSARSRSPRTPGISPEKPIDPSASFEGAGGQPGRPGGPSSWPTSGARWTSAAPTATTTTWPPTATPRSRAPPTGTAQMAVGSDDTLTVWLNGKEVYKFSDRRGFEHEQARFDVTLQQGDEPRADPVRQPGRPVAVRRRGDGAGRLRVPEGPVGRGLQPRRLSRRRAQGRGDPAAAAGSSPT